MAVVAHKPEVRKAQRVLDKVFRLSGLDCDAELRVDLARRDGLIRMRVNARGQAQKHLLADAPALGLAADNFELLLVVRHKVAHIRGHGVGDVRVGLVVSMEEGALHREARALGRCDLARRDDVNGYFFLLHDGIHALEARGFAGVERIASRSEGALHRRFVDAAVFADAVFVHKIQRRFIVRREPDGVLARKRQMAAFIDADVAAKHIMHFPCCLIMHFIIISFRFRVDCACSQISCPTCPVFSRVPQTHRPAW